MAENSMSEVHTGTVKKRNQRGKLFFGNKYFTLNKRTETAEYYRCARRDCGGRCIKADGTMTLTLTL